MLLNLLIPEIVVTEITFIDKEQHGFAFNEKKCIFDVYCRTGAGERVIIEMQFKQEDDFLDRALFYATYPIREQILSDYRRFFDRFRRWMRRKKMEAKAHPYRLKPVYVVSILNFSLQHGSATVLEDGLVCRYELRERSSGEVMTDALHFVFLELGRMQYGPEHPECCRTILEKLAFSLKYIDQLRERPGEMLEDIFKRMFDAAELAAMDAQTRRIVDRTMTTKLDMMQHLHNTYIDGHLDGEKKGRAEGAREQAVESARYFLRLGLAVEDIAKGTGLTIEEVNSLR